MKPIDIIRKSGFLRDADISFIMDNVSTIQDNFEKRQIFRTETEMRISVLNDIKFPTPAAKYWQAVREQSVFYSELVKMSFDYRRNEIEIEDLERQIQAASGKKRKLLQIDLEERQFSRENMRQVAKDRMREIRLWSAIMAELDDGSFDTEDANTHQLKSYAVRFERQAKLAGSHAPSEAINIMGQYATAMRHLSGE